MGGIIGLGVGKNVTGALRIPMVDWEKILQGRLGEVPDGLMKMVQDMVLGGLIAAVGK